MLASILESGAVYYPLLFLLPIVTGIALARWRPERRALWILVVVVLAWVALDFAFDDTRSEDVPFFVVLALFMVGLGLLARWIAGKFVGARVAL